MIINYKLVKNSKPPFKDYVMAIVYVDGVQVYRTIDYAYATLAIDQAKAYILDMLADANFTGLSIVKR
jgi:hypothetical protein